MFCSTRLLETDTYYLATTSTGKVGAKNIWRTSRHSVSRMLSCFEMFFVLQSFRSTSSILFQNRCGRWTETATRRRIQMLLWAAILMKGRTSEKKSEERHQVSSLSHCLFTFFLLAEVKVPHWLVGRWRRSAAWRVITDEQKGPGYQKKMRCMEKVQTDSVWTPPSDPPLPTSSDDDSTSSSSSI